MREIKFRAWDGEEMHNNIWMNFKIPAIMVDNDQIWFIPKELMQYTGLKDKNGIEIYEGDIVKYRKNGKPWLIEWKNDLGEEGDIVGFDGVWGDVNIEVIGNIYEHPHLLEGTMPTAS